MPPTDPNNNPLPDNAPARPPAPATDDRRAELRTPPADPIRTTTTIPVIPISDAVVLNTSTNGIAIQTRTPVTPGTRLSFSKSAEQPPILGEVLACEPLDQGWFRVRCRCLLGGFDNP